MRCYSDIEVRAITEERVPSVPSKESVSISQVPEYLTDEHFLTVHSEMPEMIQFIADLEFETKFAALLHSVALRWPAL
ncbi:MAG TPA: hypothetical protein VFH95_06835 [Candidatus Kapabacteria bacterium]|nr:hypothetical protein [Candidatus Kapabacteria bacterium]